MSRIVRAGAKRGTSGSTSYTYRQNGQRASQTSSVLDPASWAINWSYDNVDWLSKINYPDGNTVSYTYNALQNPTSVTAVIGERGCGRLG